MRTLSCFARQLRSCLLQAQHLQRISRGTMATNGSTDQIEKAKRLAARKAVDNHVKDKQIIGIGSGSTVVHAVERLAERVRSEKLDVICVPTSFQATQLIIDNDLRLSDLAIHNELDIAIDGADEVDVNFVLIKGGGGCHLEEKLVASAAKELIVIADYRKNSQQLGQQWTKGIPLEVVRGRHDLVKRKLEKQLGGTATLRMAQRKAGPVVTDYGNHIIDWQFPLERVGSPEWDWDQIDTALLKIPGVLATGLFINMATKAYFGNPDGTVTERP